MELTNLRLQKKGLNYLKMYNEMAELLQQVTTVKNDY